MNYARVFSPNLLNEFKLGYLRMRLNDAGLYSGVVDVAKQAGIMGLDPSPQAWALPAILMSDFTSLTDIAPNNLANNTYQLIDNLNWVHGKSNIKVGVEIRDFQFNLYSSPVSSSFTFNGEFTLNPATKGSGFTFADFLMGDLAQTNRNLGNTPAYLRRKSYAYYYQQDWRLHPRLTLNLGLRYEYSTPYVELRDNIISADPTAQGIVLVRAGKGDPYEGFPPARLDPSIQYVRDGRFGGHGVTAPDRNNFAPRFGMVWDPTGRSLWSVRAGVGVFYGEDIANPYFDMTRNSPHSISQALIANPNIPDLALDNAFGSPSQLLTDPRIYSVSYNLPSPYVINWSLNIHRQLPRNVLVEVGYGGNEAHKLSVFQILNIAPNGPGAVQPRRPDPELSTVSPIAPLANSNYHAGHVHVEKRYSGGLSMIFAYTYSKAIDDGNSRAPTGRSDSYAQNPLRQDLERAASDYDERNVARLGATYDLPSPAFGRRILGGWQIGSIFGYQSGNPFGIMATGSPNTGVTLLRANSVYGVSWRLPDSQHGVNEWFNTAAFSAPPLYTYGNSGRECGITRPGHHSSRHVAAEELYS